MWKYKVIVSNPKKSIEEFESNMGKPVDALTYIEKKIEYERKELEK